MCKAYLCLTQGQIYELPNVNRTQMIMQHTDYYTMLCVHHYVILACFSGPHTQKIFPWFFGLSLCNIVCVKKFSKKRQGLICRIKKRIFILLINITKLYLTDCSLLVSQVNLSQVNCQGTERSQVILFVALSQTFDWRRIVAYFVLFSYFVICFIF